MTSLRGNGEGDPPDSPPPRVLLVDGRAKEAYYPKLLSPLEAEWSSITPPALLRGPRGPIDLVLIDGETWPFTAAAIPELRRRGIPTLYLLDGILEWRYVWEQTDLVMPLFQPVLCDKVACLGRSQARMLEAWGNVGKCEVTGSPRLDPLIGRRPRRREPGTTFRILVATANTPGFTEAQIRQVERSLGDLRRWLDAHPSNHGVRIEPVWRLTGGLEHAIGVETTLHAGSLADQLLSVDALITSPSTVMLEGMLCGLPVALLDYDNRPHLVPAAWAITAPDHFDQVIPELLAPASARLLYQDAVLHDSLECLTPAAPRVAELIRAMAAAGRACRHEGEPLAFPVRILDDTQSGHHLPEASFDSRTLHPDHPVFGETDLAALQAEVAHLRNVVRFHPTQVAYRALSELQRMLRARPSGRR